jgi:hypothetical protein
VLVGIEILGDFSISESNISNSSSRISVITEVYPTPFSEVFFNWDLFIVINLIVTSIELEVIGRENEFVIIIQS